MDIPARAGAQPCRRGRRRAWQVCTGCLGSREDSAGDSPDCPCWRHVGLAFPSARRRWKQSCRAPGLGRCGRPPVSRSELGPCVGGRSRSWPPALRPPSRASRVEHTGVRVPAASARIGASEPAALRLQGTRVRVGPGRADPPPPAPALQRPSCTHIQGRPAPPTPSSYHQGPLLLSAADDSICLSLPCPWEQPGTQLPGLPGSEPSGDGGPGWGCLRPGHILVQAVPLAKPPATVSQSVGGRVRALPSVIGPSRGGPSCSPSPPGRGWTLHREGCWGTGRRIAPPGPHPNPTSPCPCFLAPQEWVDGRLAGVVPPGEGLNSHILGTQRPFHTHTHTHTHVPTMCAPCTSTCM